ncbi:alpha/beta fold hydrolase [Micromonosporaceae bacterium Da 78-11]
MPHLGVGQEQLYYEDHGAGTPVVLVHGYPLDSSSWEKQTGVLLAAGHRVITYDRRGFGRSSRPAGGYDYDTLAGDLAALLAHLDLGDCVLAGFSMGTAEIIRHLGAHGSRRVRKAVLIGSFAPFLLRGEDNPDGIDRSFFDAIRTAIAADRPAWLAGFLADAHNADVLAVSEPALRYHFAVATAASAYAIAGCVDAWLTDLRADLARIDVPVLLLHGEADRIMPIDVTANRLPDLIADLRYEVIPDGPHDVRWAFPELVNRYLLDFVGS